MGEKKGCVCRTYLSGFGFLLANSSSTPRNRACFSQLSSIMPLGLTVALNRLVSVVTVPRLL